MTLLKTTVFNLKLMGFRAKRDEFYRQLARSYENKEALRDFLNEEYKISVNKETKNASRAFALRIIRNRLASGDQSKYSQLLTGVMPASDQMMLAALDDAPDKAALMRQIAQSVVDQRKLIALVRGKLVPPLLILPGAFVFCYVFATRSIPIVVKIAPPEVWSPVNLTVRMFAEFVASYGILSVVTFSALSAYFVYQLPRWTGRWRSKLEQIHPATGAMLFPVAPFVLPLSIYRDVQVGLMFSALSVMLESGRTLNDALTNIRNSSQPWMRWHVRKILAHLEVRTTEYQQAFSTGLISPQLLARLSSEIRTNPRFDQVLIGLGKTGGEEIRNEVDKQTAKINFMLLIAAGFTVVGMMVGQLSISMSMTEEMSPQKQMMRKLKQQEAQRALQ